MSEKRGLLVRAGPQFHGFTFRLEPLDRAWVENNILNKQRVPSVYIGLDKASDFSQIHDDILNQIFMLLTGLTIEEINELGGIKIENPLTRQIVYDSLSLSNSTHVTSDK
ncbi:MAG: hypothetical protein AAF639_03500 [Chloroflexota bacterium]